MWALPDAVFESFSFQYQGHQVQAPIKRPPVPAQPFYYLEHQVEGIVPATEAFGSIGPEPYPTKDRL